MATSPIYNWPEPDNTDLVKNGALAIRTLGDAIDTTMGTMVAKTLVDAKGDLIAGTAADTVDRLAVGADGETLVADSSESTGLRYQGNYAAGKNKVINGDFNIWQRGTSFSTTGVVYCADRFLTNTGSVSGFSAAQSTFTAGTAPVAGYEGQFYLDIAGTLSNASTGYLQIEQRIESVRNFAGETVTLSFWAKGSTSGTVNTLLGQNFGAGGSAEVLTATSSQSITTSWQRFTQTVTLPSIAGKTINAGNMLKVYFVKNMGSSYPTFGSSNYTGTLSIWGVQLEAGSVATAFQTATGSIQGETSACQRYYYRTAGASGGSGYAGIGMGAALSTTSIRSWHTLPVIMRTAASMSRGGQVVFWPSGLLSSTIGAGYSSAVANGVMIDWTVSAATADRSYVIYVENSANNFLEFSAEL